MKTFKNLVIAGIMAMSMTGCYFGTVETGEAGYEKHWGEIGKETLEPGLHVNMSPGTSLGVMNIKTKRLEMKNALANREDTHDVIFDRSVNILSKNGLPIPVEMTILYHLRPEKVIDVVSRYGTDIVWDNKLVVPQVRDVSREVMGNADIYELNKERDKYSKLIVQKLNDKIGKFVVVENVMIKNIGVPVKIRQSIERKMQMKEESERAKYEVLKAKQEAEKKIAIAKGEAEKRRIQADAKAYVITKQADAQAKANIEIAKSITPELIKYRWVETWNGVVPKVSSDNSGILLNMGGLK